MKVTHNDVTKNVRSKYEDVFHLISDRLDNPKRIRMSARDNFLAEEMLWRQKLSRPIQETLEGMSPIVAIRYIHRNGDISYALKYDPLDVIVRVPKNIYRACPEKNTETTVN